MSIRTIGDSTSTATPVGLSDANRSAEKVNEMVLVRLDTPVQKPEMGAYQFNVVEMPDCLVKILVWLDENTLFELKVVSTIWKDAATLVLNEQRFGSLQAFIRLFLPDFQSQNSLYKMDKDQLFSLTRLKDSEQYIADRVCAFVLEHTQYFDEQNIHKALMAIKFQGLPSRKILKLCTSAFVGKLSAHVQTCGKEIEADLKLLRTYPAQLVLTIPRALNFKIERLKDQIGTLLALGEFEKAIQVVEKIRKNENTQMFLLESIRPVFNKLFQQSGQIEQDFEYELVERLFACAPLDNTRDKYEAGGAQIKQMRLQIYQKYLISWLNDEKKNTRIVLSYIDNLMKFYEEADFLYRYEEQVAYYTCCFTFLFTYGPPEEEARWRFYTKLSNDVARLSFLRLLVLRSSGTAYSELLNQILACQLEIVPKLEIEKSLDAQLCESLLNNLAKPETLDKPRILQVLERISFYQHACIDGLSLIPIWDLKKILTLIEPNETIEFALGQIKLILDKVQSNFNFIHSIQPIKTHQVKW